MKNVALVLMAYEHAWKICDAPAPFFTVCGIRFNIIYGLVALTLSLYLAQGFYLTRNYQDYFERLCILAFISQIPFSFMHPAMSNVIFTYLLGFMAIYLYEYRYFYASFFVLLFSYIHDPYLDWGYIAVYLIFIFYLMLSNLECKKVTFDFIRMPKIFYYAFYPLHFVVLLGAYYIM